MTTQPLTVADEMLSAFLDAELPAATMDAVRAALAQDPALAARLQVLAQVDTLVQAQSHIADSLPMPASVLALLANDESAVQPASATIVQGPWQRWRQPLALAASIALMIGVSWTYLNQAPAGSQSTSLPTLALYSDSLDQIASGTQVTVANSTLLPRFSFLSKEHQYCRQYQLSSSSERSENVACRHSGAWTVVASKKLPAANAADYQAASTASELDSMLDALMAGPALDPATEATAIKQHWQENSAGR